MAAPTFSKAWFSVSPCSTTPGKAGAGGDVNTVFIFFDDHLVASLHYNNSLWLPRTKHRF